ncbi:ArsR/SmtB family transcription factor [Haladaptatus sp. NG-SE-30]
MSEFATDVELKDIAIRDTDVSSAVDEPVRAMILDMLAERELGVAELHDELADRGYERTENTVRHHINELRDAGLVEVARLEEHRGGTTKYYRANTIVLSYAIPEGATAEIDEMANRVRPQMSNLLDTLHDEYDDDIERIGAEMAPCEHCNTQKYETYLLLSILRRAFVKVHTDGERSPSE